MSNFLERTAFERLELGTPVRTNEGFGRIIGVSEGRDGQIELYIRNLDSGKEAFYMLEDVEVID